MWRLLWANLSPFGSLVGYGCRLHAQILEAPTMPSIIAGSPETPLMISLITHVVVNIVAPATCARYGRLVWLIAWVWQWTIWGLYAEGAGVPSLAAFQPLPNHLRTQCHV